MSNPKRIQFNRTDKDYSAYYDDELIGVFASFHQAEVELDAHALDLLERGLLDTAEGITTMQWQGEPASTLNGIPEGHRRAGDDEPGWWYRLGMGLQVWITDAPEPNVVYARPAEVVELLHSDDPVPTDQEPGATCRLNVTGDYWTICRAPGDEPCCCDTFVRALPAAPAAHTIEARTPDSFSSSETSPVAGREDAAPDLTIEEQAAVKRWRERTQTKIAERMAPTAAYCLHLDTCAASSCPACTGPAGPYRCPLCKTNAHYATQCPDVALTKYGMGIWEAYLEDRAAFLKLIQWAAAARLLLMGNAVAHYLSARWGHPITGRQVLVAWMQNA